MSHAYKKAFLQEILKFKKIYLEEFCCTMSMSTAETKAINNILKLSEECFDTDDVTFETLELLNSEFDKIINILKL